MERRQNRVGIPEAKFCAKILSLNINPYSILASGQNNKKYFFVVLPAVLEPARICNGFAKSAGVCSLHPCFAEVAQSCQLPLRLFGSVGDVWSLPAFEGEG